MSVWNRSMALHEALCEETATVGRLSTNGPFSSASCKTPTGAAGICSKSKALHS
jgi:hypothetical protein